jgi:hypothetical protein
MKFTVMIQIQIVPDWMVTLDAHGPEGLLDRNASGQLSRT